MNDPHTDANVVTSPDAEATDQPAARAPRQADPAVWAADAWRALCERVADPGAFAEAERAARRRRAPSVRVSPGEIVASVPDPPSRRRRVVLRVKPFDHSTWETGVRAVADDPALSARVLSGETPARLRDVLEAEGLRLVPVKAAEFTVEPAREASSSGGWTWIAAAAALAFAKRLEDEPGLVLTLRGLSPEELRERLRQRRAVVQADTGLTPAYTQRPAPGGETVKPLEADLERFWSAGETLEQISTPMRAPASPLALLRRLGASPFDKARFPLMGLLASCYDTISQREVNAAEHALLSDPEQAPESESPSPDEAHDHPRD